MKLAQTILFLFFVLVSIATARKIRDQERVEAVSCVPFNCKTNNDCAKMATTKVCVSNPRTFAKGMYCCSARP